MLEHVLPVMEGGIKTGSAKPVMEQESITIQPSSAMHARGVEPISIPHNDVVNVVVREAIKMVLASSARGAVFLRLRKRWSAENVKGVGTLKQQVLSRVKDVMERVITIQNATNVVDQDTTHLDEKN